MSADVRLIERALVDLDRRIRPIRERIPQLLRELQDLELGLRLLEQERRFILEEHAAALKRDL